MKHLGVTVFAVSILCLAPGAKADVVSDWMARGKAIADSRSAAPDFEFTEADFTWRSHTALAMFEALDAVDRRYESYLKLPETKGADGDAAAAQAAHDVLVHYFPDHKAELEKALESALDNAGPGASKTAGVALGASVARATLAVGGIDPQKPPMPYTPYTSAGTYVPTTLPRFAPWVLCMRPWFLKSIDALRPPPPVDLHSRQWAADFNEVRRLGAKTGSERTPEQTLIAQFWAFADTDFVLDDIAAEPGRSPLVNARLYALAAMVDEDAGLVLVDAKMHYGFWRPITAIRNGAIDGNDGTTAVPGWEPLLRTPMHPEYPCGHCVGAHVFATVAESETVPGQVFTFKTETLPGVLRTVSLEDYAKEVSLSRIYGGVHYPSTVAVSDKLGETIARHALAVFARPLNQ